MNTNLNNRNINKTYTGNSEKISVIIVDDNEKVIENIDSALLVRLKMVRRLMN